MDEIKEVQSLTTPEGVYNSFPDKTARAEIEKLKQGGTGNGSGQNPASGGLTTAQISALDGMFRACGCAEKAPEAYAAFMEAFGINVEDITLDGSVLTIKSLATEPVQDDGVLTIM